MGKLQLALCALLLCALMIAGCDREITGEVKDEDFTTADNCLSCHSGFLDQAQGEWVNSTHASGNNIDYTNRGGSDCTRCHNQQGFLSYLETGELPDVPFESVSAIGCFTCHDPHENGNMDLRALDPVTLANGDVFDHGAGTLCANCHQSRGSAGNIADGQGLSRYFGPHHGPQGDMVNGSNGYEFPGEGYTFTSSPHATQVRDACAGCHMGNERTHLGYGVGGHTWKMEDEDSGEDMHAFCANDGCHPSSSEFDFVGQDSIDYDFDGVVEGYQTEIEGLLDSLGTLLEGQGLLADDHPTTTTVADGHLAGAVWNYMMILEDRSKGVHNFNYARSLLLASIDYVENNGTPPVASASTGAKANNLALVSGH